MFVPVTLCLFFCVFLFASSSRSPSDVPSFLRGPRVRPVAWPWRPGSSSGLPPRPYVAEPLTNGLFVVEVIPSCLYFKHKSKGRSVQYKAWISTEGWEAVDVVTVNRKQEVG